MSIVNFRTERTRFDGPGGPAASPYNLEEAARLFVAIARERGGEFHDHPLSDRPTVVLSGKSLEVALSAMGTVRDGHLTAWRFFQRLFQ